MKRFLILISAVCFLTSCDFIRAVASRPTSSDIQAKQWKIVVAEAAHAARVDSVARLQDSAGDSLALEESALERASSIISAGHLSGLEASRLKYKYYVVIGSFSKTSNADRLDNAATAAGYQVTRISFNNGYSAVAVCGGNVLSLVLNDVDSLRKQPFCPADVWILKNE